MNSKRIGNKLRKLRGKRTLAEVSRDLGISDAALCAYELGQRVPRDDKTYWNLQARTWML